MEPGENLDRLVAKIMGEEHLALTYSTDECAAMRVAASVGNLELYDVNSNSVMARTTDGTVAVLGRTLSHAICLAALRIRGIQY